MTLLEPHASPRISRLSYPSPLGLTSLLHSPPRISHHVSDLTSCLRSYIAPQIYLSTETASHGEKKSPSVKSDTKVWSAASSGPWGCWDVHNFQANIIFLSNSVEAHLSILQILTSGTSPQFKLFLTALAL